MNSPCHPEDHPDVIHSLSTLSWLGKQVWIQFTHEDGSAPTFYRGEIRESNMTLKNDGTHRVMHCIYFDDGDKTWFHLKTQQEQGSLRWTAPPEDDTPAYANNDAPANAKEEEDEVEDKPRLDRTKRARRSQNCRGMKKEKTEDDDEEVNSKAGEHTWPTKQEDEADEGLDSKAKSQQEEKDWPRGRRIR